jgi:hypothetical protein
MWCESTRPLQRQLNSHPQVRTAERARNSRVHVPQALSFLVLMQSRVLLCAQRSNMTSSGQVDEQQRAGLWRARRLRPAVESNFPRMSECAFRMNAHDPCPWSANRTSMGLHAVCGSTCTASLQNGDRSEPLVQVCGMFWQMPCARMVVVGLLIFCSHLTNTYLPFSCNVTGALWN